MTLLLPAVQQDMALSLRSVRSVVAVQVPLGADGVT